MSASPELNAQLMGLFWTLRLAEPLPVVPVPRIPANFLRAGPELAAELASAMELESPAPVLQRFQRGCHCHIVRSAGRLVAYGWITFDQELIGGLDLRVRLLPGEVYIWDCATLPDYRGQGLYSALLAHMQRVLQCNGFQRLWIGMDADNQPSQSGVARAGFQRIIDILQFRDTPVRTLLARSHPGASEREVQAARYTLFGNREASQITLPEPHHEEE